MSASTNELLTVKEVMAYLKISRSTLYRYIKEKRLKVVKLGPKSIRFHRADVEALVEASTQD